MFRYIFSTLVSGLFLFYGITTLIFATPDNFINISLIEYSEKFNTFFYQRWGFFAPPPQSNDRLYYVFEKKENKGEIIVYEVIEPLLKQKSSNAPFNGNEDLIDYLISNSIYLITDGIRAVRESYEYEAKLKNKKINEFELTKKVNKVIESTKPFKTLLNYSKKVALNNKIEYDDYNVYLKITQTKVPKFIDRYKKNFKENEQLIFDSSN
ncbi:hypothetical protein WFZ85_09820 [Flavobacterium sp. j3]|uniref:Uncharacterized protein n=1 Tax=Flavobacterium aureirubrum TaxID=3133147 RepID=A0ABU9N836_9FLAO